MANQKTNKTTKQVKEVKEMKKNNKVICNELAYEAETKKGTKVIILVDYQGNYHYIEIAKQKKYNQYTGEAYTSNNHRAYTFIEDTFEDTEDNENAEDAL